MHNLEHSYVTEEKIFSDTINMYNPCNLHIFIDDGLEEKIYREQLLKVLNELKNKNIEVSLTGNEPTLLPERLIFVLNECHKRNMTFRTINTSGYKFLSSIENKALCRYIVQNGCINNININRFHYDDLINKKFDRYGITNDEIEKLAYYFYINGADIRISVPLVKGGVENMEDIKNLINRYEKLSITSFIFREREIQLKDVFVLNDDFYFLRTLDDDYYKVKVYKYHDYIVKHYTEKNILHNDISSMIFKDGSLKSNNLTLFSMKDQL